MSRQIKQLKNVDTEIYEKSRKKYFKDKEFRKAYESERVLFMLSEEIRKYRKLKHYSQKELAKRAGMKQQEISRIESGYPDAKVSTLIKIAAGMGRHLELKIK